MKKLPIAIPLIVLIPLAAAGAGACASAPSKPKASDAPLVIPPPPPHVVPITPEPIVEPVAEIPPATGAASPPRTGRGNREASPKPGANDTRPEAKPGTTTAEAPPAADTPPASPPPPSGPPPQLRTAESSGTEGTVRATIDRTRQILTTVDYRHLTEIRKKAYNDAKKFADQADEALKQGNVVFAQGVAAKAETLAKELAGR